MANILEWHHKLHLNYILNSLLLGIINMNRYMTFEHCKHLLILVIPLELLFLRCSFHQCIYQYASPIVHKNCFSWLNLKPQVEFFWVFCWVQLASASSLFGTHVKTTHAQSNQTRRRTLTLELLGNTPKVWKREHTVLLQEGSRAID